ncbi:cytochrome c biogenesis protein CcsA, partial [bacterium]|nr:cytochrome c biogenesis protein CcsA [bacterium]
MLKTTLFLHNLSLVLYAAAAIYSTATLFVRRLPLIVGRLTALAGVATQLVLLVMRWNAGSHLPVTGLFESQHFLALWVSAIAVYFSYRYRADSFMPAAMVLAVASLLFAGKGPMDVSPLTPAIDTPLFLIHVATSFAAYGLFGIAALLAVYRTLDWPG